MAQRVYSWRHSLPDHRDLHADVAELVILPEVDPRPMMPHIFDQGQLGSCTANAVSACIEYDRTMDNPTHPNLQRPSRLMIYYGERMLEGSLSNGDCGAVGRDGFKFAQRYGWVKEGQWPYDIASYAVDPPQAIWTAALDNRLTKQYAVVPQDENSIKAVLSNNQTVAWGFSVYSSFESDKVATTGIVPMPSSRERFLGGHECLIVGYLEANPGYFLARNSWNTSWGMLGYFLMPVEYVVNSSLSSDLRTIVRPLAA